MIMNGLIVVRLPQFNYRDILGSRPTRTRIPVVGNIFYCGIDRQPWADVLDLDYFAKRTPQTIVQLAKEINNKNDDVTGIEVCQDIAVAHELLSYSNRHMNNNELVAVRATALNDFKGTMDTMLRVEWIGFDFVALGEWSLIANGMFMYPEDYSAWFERINRFGLFDDAALLRDYALAYEEAVKADRSEPLAPSSAGIKIAAIEVGRVDVS